MVKTIITFRVPNKVYFYQGTNQSFDQVGPNMFESWQQRVWTLTLLKCSWVSELKKLDGPSCIAMPTAKLKLFSAHPFMFITVGFRLDWIQYFCSSLRCSFSSSSYLGPTPKTIKPLHSPCSQQWGPHSFSANIFKEKKFCQELNLGPWGVRCKRYVYAMPTPIHVLDCI